MLQELLTRAGGRTASWTPHQEQETLYWTKAASLLGRPQVDMADSVVPYHRPTAERELRMFLARNLPTWEQPGESDDLVIGGWQALNEEFGPVFVEKSPHHLHQWSALTLAIETCRALPELRLRVIGLVRDPMDTLYSMWTRWRFRPAVHQFEWSSAYSNLLRLNLLLEPDELHVVRYEDLVTSASAARAVGEFAGVAVDPKILSPRSLGRWKADGRWGHVLDPSVVQVAADFGYSSFPDFGPATRAQWALNCELLVASRRVRQRMGALRRRIAPSHYERS